MCITLYVINVNNEQSDDNYNYLTNKSSKNEYKNTHRFQ